MDEPLSSFEHNSSKPQSASNIKIAGIGYAPCKHAISRSSLPGLAYAFNPYVGCGHGCIYCYAPDVLRYNASVEWGKNISAKEGILERLKEDLRRATPGVVGVSTVTDPYQPAERSFELTRGALKLLKASGFPVSIQTKSSLVERDLDMLKGGKFELGITINSLADDFRKLFEPGASPPEDRAAALQEASSRSITTWIFYGPIIPSFNDSPEIIKDLVALARKTGSRLIYDRLNFKPLMLCRMRRFISESTIVSIKNYNFAEMYKKIEKECFDQGVSCSPAF